MKPRIFVPICLILLLLGTAVAALARHPRLTERRTGIVRPVHTIFPEQDRFAREILEQTQGAGVKKTFNPKEIRLDEDGVPTEEEIPRSLEEDPAETAAVCNDNKYRIVIAAGKWIPLHPKEYEGVSLERLVADGLLGSVPVCPYETSPGRYNLIVDTIDYRPGKAANRKKLLDVVMVRVGCSAHEGIVSRPANPDLAKMICKQYRKKVRSAAVRYARKHGGKTGSINELIGAGLLSPKYSRCPAEGVYSVTLLVNRNGVIYGARVDCSVCGR